MSLHGQKTIGTIDIGQGPCQADPHIMATGRVPSSVYTSQERFEQEREVFRKVWLYVGRHEEIPNAGDWFVKDIAVLPASAIVVRGKDGVIRAFHNICSHRNMKLAWDKQGRGGKFSCPYHAWTYDSQGALIHVPDAACFPGLDRQESGLAPIACETFEGFVFINFAPAQSLETFLGPVAERLRGAPFGDYLYAGRISDTLNANWKLGLEAASEGYHVQVLHKNTAREMISWPGNPHVHYADWEPLGPHRNMIVDLNPTYKLPEDKPVQKFAFSSAPGMVVRGGADAAPQGFVSHPGFNRINSQLWASEQFNFFPNFNIHTALNGWWSMAYWPIAPGKALWESKYYSRKPSRTREVFAAHYSLALNRDTIAEDNLCMQQQQAAMETGGKAFIQFGEQEIACSHFAAVWEAVANPQRTPFRQAAE